MNDKLIEDRIKYVKENIELLINVLKSYNVGDIIFQKKKINKFYLNSTNQKIDNGIYITYNAVKKIKEIQDNVFFLFSVDSSLFYNPDTKTSKSKITDEQMEIFLDYLVEQGFLVKQIHEKSIYNQKSEITDYKLTLKIFLSSSLQSFIFYAMEFPEPKNEDNDKKYRFYKKLKKEIEKKLHLKVVMLYDDKKSGNLNTRIKNEIKNCSFFIADLTSKDNFNSNVMYEIGMAEGFNKKILQIMSEEKWIQLEQESKKLPFDISTHNTIAYSMDETKWESNISEIIRTIQSSLK